MLRCDLFTTDENAWRDAARRLRRASIETIHAAPRIDSASDTAADIYVGAAEADPAAIEQSLSAGRHVLAVAEPCLNGATLASLTALAAKKQVRFAVQNPDGYLPSRTTIKSQLGGSLGSPELVRIHRWESHAAAETTSPLGLPGALVAEIEQAQWLTARPVTNVYAVEQRAAGGNGGRFLQIHLKFDNGMALIDYDDRLPEAAGGPSSSYRSLSVIGASGSAQIDDQANVQLLYGGGLPKAVTVGEGVRHLATLLDDFAGAVASKRETRKGVQLWQDVAAVVDRVVRSLKDREAVALEAAR
jgi:hypothetical protein